MACNTYLLSTFYLLDRDTPGKQEKVGLQLESNCISHKVEHNCLNLCHCCLGVAWGIFSSTTRGELICEAEYFYLLHDPLELNGSSIGMCSHTCDIFLALSSSLSANGNASWRDMLGSSEVTEASWLMVSNKDVGMWKELHSRYLYFP